MINKLQIKEVMSIIFLVIFLGFLGGFFVSQVGLSIVDVIKGPVTLEADAELADMEGNYVSYEVKYPLGEYLEITKETKVNGVSQGTKKDRSSYVVIDEDRGICLSVQIPVSKYSEMRQLEDQFYDALTEDADLVSEGITIKGSLDRLEGEDLDYYIEAMEYAELPVEEIVYHISDGMIKGNKMANIYGFSIMGILFIGMALAMIIITMKDPVKRRVNRYLEAHPTVTMAQLESDFSAAQKIGNVWVGKNWTFCAGLKEALFENKDIVWVHTGRERSGRSVSFLVYFNLIDRTVKRVSMSSVKNCEKVMKLYESYPHILTGNNQEYDNLCYSNWDAFLDIKYRQQRI